MRMFFINVLLAILWMALWGSFDAYTLLAGLAVGYVVLGLVSLALPGQTYGGRLGRLARFGVYFIRILIKANWDVAKAVLTPGFNQTCRIIRYPVADLNDVQLTTLASAITLTPGTLSLDVSDDQKWLYIHCMIGHDRDAVTRDLDDLRHRLLKEFL